MEENTPELNSSDERSETSDSDADSEPGEDEDGSGEDENGSGEDENGSDDHGEESADRQRKSHRSRVGTSVQFSKVKVTMVTPSRFKKSSGVPEYIAVSSDTKSGSDDDLLDVVPLDQPPRRTHTKRQRSPSPATQHAMKGKGRVVSSPHTSSSDASLTNTQYVDRERKYRQQAFSFDG